ncbi:MAG: hypothetical protein SFT92_08230 [Rickettsiales bacterium]|nr:hypothetical protein [Rickettsiales bacterium]
MAYLHRPVRHVKYGPVDPENERRLFQSRQNQLRDAVERATQKHPELAGEIRAIAAETTKEDIAFHNDPRHLGPEAGPMIHAANVRIFQKFKGTEKGRDAWKALQQELRPPGILDKTIGQFYNPDGGGIQIGGIIGALVGGFMAWKFAGESAMGGNLLGIIAVVTMTLASAWAGNKISGVISDGVKKARSSGPETGKAAGVSLAGASVAQAQEKSEGPTTKRFENAEEFDRWRNGLDSTLQAQIPQQDAAFFANKGTITVTDNAPTLADNIEIKPAAGDATNINLPAGQAILPRGTTQAR